MKKIIIIGGGIAGLAAAHFLCKYPEFEISIYESEAEVGGQARSRLGKHCYIEYCWRIFGSTYHNINKIINEIGADENFTFMTNTCTVTRDSIERGDTLILIPIL